MRTIEWLRLSVVPITLLGLTRCSHHTAPPSVANAQPVVVVNNTTQSTTVVQVQSAPAGPRRPSPTTQVRNVALVEETAASRAGSDRRPGSATAFEANVHATPFRTSDGKSGWKIDLGAGRPLATPAVVNGAVYVGGGFGGHEFYAFNAVDGATRWSIRVSDDGPTAAVVDEDLIAFNTESCTLFVVEAGSGRMRWSRWLGDPLMSQPAIAQGKVFMAFPHGGEHRLVAFDLRSGDELWRVPLAGDIISAPVVSGDAVYASTFNGTIYKYRVSDGGLAWSEEYRATSAPWLYGDQVLVSHREDHLDQPAAAPQRRYIHPLLALPYFFQVESVGRISGASGASDGAYRARPAPWLNREVQHRSNYQQSQSQSDTSVGFSTAPATARVAEAAANIGQGTVQGLWEYQGSRPAVIDGRMFLTQGDQLVAMDPETGHEHWHLALQGLLAQHGGHLASPPSAAGSKLYLATVTGDILVVQQRDGAVVDTIHVGHPMRFQPAVMDGRLYVGTADGQLIMIDLHDPSATGWSMWGGSAHHNGPN